MTRTIKIENGDWVMDRTTGRPVMLDASDGTNTKVRQDLRECLSINPLTNGFGAGLDLLIGQDADPYAMQASLQRAIRRAVVAMQRLQQQFQVSKRPASERIATIASLQVVPAGAPGSASSKTSFSFKLAVLTVAGTSVNVGVQAQP